MSVKEKTRESVTFGALAGGNFGQTVTGAVRSSFRGQQFSDILSQDHEGDRMPARNQVRFPSGGGLKLIELLKPSRFIYKPGVIVEKASREIISFLLIWQASFPNNWLEKQDTRVFVSTGFRQVCVMYSFHGMGFFNEIFIFL